MFYQKIELNIYHGHRPAGCFENCRRKELDADFARGVLDAGGKNLMKVTPLGSMLEILFRRNINLSMQNFDAVWLLSY